VRYRITPFAEAFHNQNGPLGIKEIPKGILGRIRLANGLKGSQLILQRKLLPVWQTQWLRKRVKNLVFDFDDAVILRDSYHPKGFYDRKRLSRFQAVMEAADAVVAGNQYLAERASEFRKNTRTYIIPTCINPSLYPPNTRTRGPGDPFYLAWIGSSSTLQGVEAQANTWNLVGREVGDSILRVICDRFLRVLVTPLDPMSDGLDRLLLLLLL
jgi:glycosyltransferase involved in cell wall biosynthesis